MVTPTSARRRVSLLGATGSVGKSALDILLAHQDAFEVEALTARCDVEGLARAARATKARLAVVADESCLPDLRDALAGTETEIAGGDAAVVEAASRPADVVIAAIVGAVGLRSSLAALRHGRTVALANKECLVCAGALFMSEARRHGTTVLPVDSEHNAVFQVLEERSRDMVERIVLTASGGPFREWPAQRMEAATRADALRHPNWTMGAKVTVDSATLMNKGLELIEAQHLFGVVPDTLDILVHPQSIVHGLVHYRDGSVLAQLASPDMRTPIAHCLGWPARLSAPVERLDLASLSGLTFERPDLQRFPALALALTAMRHGGAAPTLLNAANEVAVAAFLADRIGFRDIARLVEAAIEKLTGHVNLNEPLSVEEALQLDAVGRSMANELLPRFEARPRAPAAAG